MTDLPLPPATVVMPVRNEADFIDRSLGAVLQQDYPADRLEVIVVDGMSKDGTRERIEALAASAAGVAVHRVDNPGRIAAQALNLGVRRARGEVVVRVDGHCVVAPDFVRRGVEALLADPGLGCAGGPLETAGEGKVARAIAAAMGSRFGVGGSAFRVGTDVPREVDTVAFPAFRRDVLEECGPFDEELVRNQDDEYSCRLRKRGYRILLTPAIRATYFSRAGFQSLLIQYFQYGFWKVRVLQKHPRQMRPRQFMPPALVLGLGGGVLLLPWSVWPLAALGGLYLAANLVAAIVVAAHRGFELLPHLSLAFACLHGAYGLGFLVGLVRFATRWGEAQETREGPVREASDA